MEEVYYDVKLNRTIKNVQPMTGIVFWQETIEDNPALVPENAVQLEYSYMRYCDVVREKGVYDWKKVDDLLDSIKSRKHQAILRFFYVYPGNETTVPSYIKMLSDYTETEGVTEDNPTWFPDWSHPELQLFTKEFYSRFAERYDRDPRIAFLQVGFGLWGEYHIYEGPFVLGKTFPSKEFQKDFIGHLAKQFKELHWSVSIDAMSDEYSPFKESPQLLEIQFGLFDDSFMHKDHHDYNEDCWNFFNYKEKFQVSPHGGELGYYTEFDQKHALDVAGMHGRTFEQLAKKFHISYMIGNDQFKYQSGERIKQAGLNCGYSFKVIQFKASGSNSIVTITNEGVAPIYYDAYVAINGVRSAESLKGLLPGSTRLFHIPVGGRRLKLTIESDRLVPGQKIQYSGKI